MKKAPNLSPFFRPVQGGILAGLANLDWNRVEEIDPTNHKSYMEFANLVAIALMTGKVVNFDASKSYMGGGKPIIRDYYLDAFISGIDRFLLDKLMEGYYITDWNPNEIPISQGPSEDPSPDFILRKDNMHLVVDLRLQPSITKKAIDRMNQFLLEYKGNLERKRESNQMVDGVYVFATESSVVSCDMIGQSLAIEGPTYALLKDDVPIPIARKLHKNLLAMRDYTLKDQESQKRLFAPLSTNYPDVTDYSGLNKAAKDLLSNQKKGSKNDKTSTQQKTSKSTTVQSSYKSKRPVVTQEKKGNQSKSVSQKQVVKGKTDQKNNKNRAYEESEPEEDEEEEQEEVQDEDQDPEEDEVDDEDDVDEPEQDDAQYDDEEQEEEEEEEEEEPVPAPVTRKLGSKSSTLPKVQPPQGRATTALSQSTKNASMKRG